MMPGEEAPPSLPGKEQVLSKWCWELLNSEVTHLPQVTSHRTGRARWCTQTPSPRRGPLPHRAACSGGRGASKHSGFLFFQVGPHALRC